jgi:pentatricopeptide repeat protein
VLHAISKERDPTWIRRAEDLFHEMKELRDSRKLSISEISYHVMMNVHGKSGDRDGARKAEGLLRSMEENGLSPNNMSYNICIDAYARRGGSGESVKKAESFIEEMIQLADAGREDCRPTIHSFASVVSLVPSVLQVLHFSYF